MANASFARAERVADLIMLSHEPMLAWRLDGPIEFWNAGAERLYGFTSTEAVGRSSHALLQTKFPIEFAELRSQLQSERYWSGELRHKCKDGHEVIVDSRMQLLVDGTVLEVNRDVTELKTLAARQAALASDLSTAATKFEALFNQSGSSPALWTCKATCGKRTTCRWNGADTRESRFSTGRSGTPLGGVVPKR